jgi:nucleoside-diphosphate-sugar epimerase
MRIAILGATSQIAKDLILSFAAHSTHELVLYARRPEAVTQWLTQEKLAQRYVAADFAAFTSNEHFDAILNFVGVGNPAQAAAMGASIFDVTLHYDELALGYVRTHPQCRYLFLSSGAAYGSSFETPADINTKAVIDINHLQPQDWYGVAKLHAECRHRALPNLSIIDIRVFNYFSCTQDISARFLITDIVRAIRDKNVLKTSSDYIVRDYLHPSDFYKLVNALLSAPAANVAVDCYSRTPIDKPNLLTVMQEKFGLQYEITQASVGVNATGIKPNYYSLNTRASGFGYQPTLTSLEGIVKEMQVILQGTARGIDRE